MKKTILEIYSLAVCFVVLICFAVILGRASYDIMQIKNPEFTLSSWQFEKLQSNDNFCANNPAIGKKSECSNRSDSEITKIRQTAYTMALKSEERNGFQGLAISIIILLINIIIFIPHWIIARRARA